MFLDFPLCGIDVYGRILKITVFCVFICSKKFVDEFLGDKNASSTLVELRLKIELVFFGLAEVVGFNIYFFYVIINLS
jgi:hypothetical protein